jgi:4-phytase/acid phosphatase
MRIVRFWILTLSSLLAVQPASAAPVLDKVVMLSRHGVRSPLRSMEVLEVLTRRNWPKWPVGPGVMTEHGAHDLALMGDYLRSRYAEAGILPARACPAAGAVAIRADTADDRTRRSGAILADRLAPGCALVSTYASTPDPLFDSTLTNACPVNLLSAAAAMIASARSAGEAVQSEDRWSLEVLQGILAPQACDPGATGLCLVPAARDSAAKSAAKLAVGSAVAEAIYLEYVQGFPAADVGWGKAADPQTIAAIMPAHDRDMDVRRRTPLEAARRGALMAQTIVALLRGVPLPPGAPALSPQSKLVMIAGHDSNLLYMGTLMGLDWRLPNQPNPAAPDTTMALEVWRDPSTGTRSLRVAIYGQTLTQLREGSPLGPANPPDVVSVVPEACANAPAEGCPVETFAAWVDRRVASLCGK